MDFEYLLYSIFFIKQVQNDMKGLQDDPTKLTPHSKPTFVKCSYTLFKKRGKNT